MNRHVVRLAVGLVLAAVVWKAARTTAPPGPAVAPPPATAEAPPREPGRLPADLLAADRRPVADPHVRPAAALQQTEPLAVVRVTEVFPASDKTAVWNVTQPTAP